MRPARPAAFVFAAAVGLAACASGQTAGWTFAPVSPTPSAAASGGAPGSPAAGASGGAAPSASVPASSGTSAGAASLAIAAQNVQFSTTSLEVSAGIPFQIVFDNQDPGIQHNVAIKDSSQKVLFAGEIVTGPIMKTYDVAALQAGTYTFVCQVHPTMTGTLTVK